MKYAPLVLAMLWRSPARTAFTFLSVACAFVLFGLLHTMNQSLSAGVRFAEEERLIVTGRLGLAQFMPYTYRHQLEEVQGIEDVTPVVSLLASYQQPSNSFQALAVDSVTLFRIDPRRSVSAEQLALFTQVRTGVIAGKKLVEKYGWRIGDKLPLRLNWPKTDGSNDWEFDLVGVYEIDRNLAKPGFGLSEDQLLVNYAYFDDAGAGDALVQWYTVRLKAGADVKGASNQIDQVFDSQPVQTSTQTEHSFIEAAASQLGEIGVLIGTIFAAISFALVLMVANTTIEAFRERLTDLAVLKVLGFVEAKVAALVIAETFFMCFPAAAIGMTAAALTQPTVEKALSGVIPAMPLDVSMFLDGSGAAILLVLFTAAVPVWRSARLSIVDGLAGRS